MPRVVGSESGQSLAALVTSRTVTLTLASFSWKAGETAALQDGDVIYAHVTGLAGNGGLAYTTPSSGGTWTSLLTVTEQANVRGCKLFRRVITNAAGEPTTWAFTVTGTSGAGGLGLAVRVVVVRGADTTTPEDGVTPTGNHSAGVSGLTATAPDIDPTGATDLLIRFFGDCSNLNGTYSGYTSSLVEDFDDGDGIAVASKLLASAAAAGTSTATINASRRWVAVSIVVKPALAVVAVAGAVAPAGAVAEQTAKPLAGGSTPAGSRSARVDRLVAGGTAPTGAHAATTAKSLAGGSTPAGAASFAAIVVRALAGSVASAGALAARVTKNLAGGSTPAGSLAAAWRAVISLGGAVAPAGAVARVAARSLAGAVTPAGTLLRRAARALAGLIAAAGSLVLQRFVATGSPSTARLAVRDERAELAARDRASLRVRPASARLTRR